MPAPPSPVTSAPPAHGAPAQGDSARVDPARDDIGQPVLPLRVRLASLVPQLRNAPPAYPPLPGRYGDPRPPDEARATVSAIQHGWEHSVRTLPPPDEKPPQDGREPERTPT